MAVQGPHSGAEGTISLRRDRWGGNFVSDALGVGCSDSVLDPALPRWSAARAASAMMVSAGFALPRVGHTLPSTTKRSGTAKVPQGPVHDACPELR